MQTVQAVNCRGNACIPHPKICQPKSQFLRLMDGAWSTHILIWILILIFGLRLCWILCYHFCERLLQWIPPLWLAEDQRWCLGCMSLTGPTLHYASHSQSLFWGCTTILQCPQKTVKASALHIVSVPPTPHSTPTMHVQQAPIVQAEHHRSLSGRISPMSPPALAQANRIARTSPAVLKNTLYVAVQGENI